MRRGQCNFGLAGDIVLPMNLMKIFSPLDPHKAELPDDLLELGLDIRRLGAAPRRALWDEQVRLTREARLAPSLLAVRLFVWYVTESKLFDPRALARPGSLGQSIATMRKWASGDSVIAAMVEIEISSLKLFLYQVFENANAPRSAILSAQERLLDA